MLAVEDRKPVSAEAFLEIELEPEYKIRIPPHWEADDFKKIFRLSRELIY